MRPASRISAMSRLDFRTITLLPELPPEDRPALLNRPIAVNAHEHAMGKVVTHQRSRLLVIDEQTVPNGVGLVVGPAVQLATAFVALPRNLRGEKAMWYIA